jgi:nucleoside-diphosphate-sugar epimerase
VEGFIAAAASEKAVGGTFNLGSGREISIGDLAGLIGKLVGREVQVGIDTERLRPQGSEVERLLADNSKAKTVLNWQSSTSLEHGLQQTIDWLKPNLNKYRPEIYAV